MPSRLTRTSSHPCANPWTDSTLIGPAKGLFAGLVAAGPTSRVKNAPTSMDHADPATIQKTTESVRLILLSRSGPTKQVKHACFDSA